MKTSTSRSALKFACMILGFSWSASSHSVVVLIDQFAVTRDGTNFFTDTFSNNLTPSQETSTYGVTGAFPNGAEAGGLLTLNSDWGAFGSNALGEVRQTLAAQLLSNVNPANPTSGLSSTNTIAVTGTFSLVTPTGPLTNGYGIQVQDIVFQQGQTQVAELDVQYNAAFGGDVIRFLLQDFTNNTIATLGFVPLVPPPGVDQIELAISRPSATNPDFYGSYAFGVGGSFGPLQQFSTPTALFRDTDFVRARFIDFTAVPEPGTLALLGFGLAALVVSRRRTQ